MWSDHFSIQFLFLSFYINMYFCIPHECLIFLASWWKPADIIFRSISCHCCSCSMWNKKKKKRECEREKERKNTGKKKNYSSIPKQSSHLLLLWKTANKMIVLFNCYGNYLIVFLREYSQNWFFFSPLQQNIRLLAFVKKRIKGF